MKKGFVVSAILYPLLVMFLVLVMGILAMGQNRRKILDNMKLEVSEESETDPEMSNSVLYYKMKALEEAYAEMSSRLSEERFEELEEILKNYTDDKMSIATTTTQNYTDSLISTLKASITNNINTAKRESKLETFPVGSIFISTTSTNPSSYIGGTWEAYGQGRTLIGVGSGTDSNSKSQTFSSGSVGGEYTHTLTTNEMPSHAGHLNTNSGVAYVGNSTMYLAFSLANSYGSSGRGWNVNNGNELYPSGVSRGNGGSHNNIQPYIVVYFWKRSA